MEKKMEMKRSYTSFYLDSPLVMERSVDIFEPENVTCDTALFIVHGGGWHAGSHHSCHKLLAAFNERGILCATTGYRLHGVNALEQLADIREGYDFFLTYLKEHQRPLRIGVWGESAGAHLASLLLCAKPGECGDAPGLKNEWVPPVCGILQSTPAQFTPWTDIFPGIWSAMQGIAGCSWQEHPERYEALSLCRYIREDNPVLFFAEAQNEHMFPPEMNCELVRRHNAMGIPSQWKMYKSVEHGFFYELTRWQQKLFFEDIVLFLNGKPVPLTDADRKRGELYLQMTRY